MLRSIRPIVTISPMRLVQPSQKLRACGPSICRFYNVPNKRNIIASSPIQSRQRSSIMNWNSIRSNNRPLATASSTSSVQGRGYISEQAEATTIRQRKERAEMRKVKMRMSKRATATATQAEEIGKLWSLILLT